MHTRWRRPANQSRIHMAASPECHVHWLLPLVSWWCSHHSTAPRHNRPYVVLMSPTQHCTTTQQAMCRYDVPNTTLRHDTTGRVSWRCSQHSTSSRHNRQWDVMDYVIKSICLTNFIFLRPFLLCCTEWQINFQQCTLFTVGEKSSGLWYSYHG